MLNAQEWGEPRELTGVGWNDHEIAIDSDNNIYIVAWGDGSRISFIKSTDGGKSWSKNKDLKEGFPELALDPDIAVDSDDNLYVVFGYDVSNDLEEYERYQLFFTKSEDRGETWLEDPIQIASTQTCSMIPRIVIDSKDTIHVIWHEQLNPYYPPVDIYHIKSKDGGETWSAPYWIVGCGGGGASMLDTAVDSGDTIYGIWELCGMRCYKSIDGGDSWTFSEIDIGGGGPYPELAIDSTDTIHVVWCREGEESKLYYYYSKSEDGGETWSDRKEVALGSGYCPFGPSGWASIAVDSKNIIFVAYQDASSGNYEIYCTVSLDNGNTWIESEKITNTPIYSMQPTIVIDANHVIHLTWGEIDWDKPGSYLHYINSPVFDPPVEQIEQIESIVTILQNIIDVNPGTPKADKLEDAKNKLENALDELNKTPPDNQAAVGNIEGAVGDLEAAVNDGLLDPGQGEQLMDQLARIARQLAVDAIDEAIAQGGDPQKITEAEQAAADGDSFVDAGMFKDAVNKYKDALAKAESMLY